MSDDEVVQKMQMMKAMLEARIEEIRAQRAAAQSEQASPDVSKGTRDE